MPPSGPRTARELPWVENHILGKTSPRVGVGKDSTEARIQALDGLSSLPRRDSGNSDPVSFAIPSSDIPLPSIHRLPTEEILPDTPPLTPVVDPDSEDEEIVSLRAAIAASLDALRSNTFSSVKSILKQTTAPIFTPIGRSSSSFTGRHLSGSIIRSSAQLQSISPSSSALNSLSTDQSSLTSGPSLALVDGQEWSSPVTNASKKSVRWNLSDDQELRELHKPQGPSSPGKLHRGNCLIFADDSPDELMSVCSDDGPTPPLSPNASTTEEDYFSLYDMKRDSVQSNSFPSPVRATSPFHTRPYTSLSNSSTSSILLSSSTKTPASDSIPSLPPTRTLSFGSPRKRTAISTRTDDPAVVTDSIPVLKAKSTPKVSLAAIPKLSTRPNAPHASQGPLHSTEPQTAPLVRSSGLPSLMRASSSQSLPPPSFIQDFGGGTNNVRTNTRANALIGTLNDPHETGSFSSQKSSTSTLKRSKSDFQSVSVSKNPKKRQRSPQTEDAEPDTQPPQEKKWLPIS